jgi:hypothetical protein
LGVPLQVVLSTISFYFIAFFIKAKNKKDAVTITNVNPVFNTNLN